MPLGRGWAVGSSAWGALVAPAGFAPPASCGASSFKVVPVITPRPIPITVSRNTRRSGPPQPGVLLERLGRLALTGAACRRSDRTLRGPLPRCPTQLAHHAAQQGNLRLLHLGPLQQCSQLGHPRCCCMGIKEAHLKQQRFGIGQGRL